MIKKPIKKPKYIDPTSDFGFKKLFGDEANKDLLIDFLNSMLPEQYQIDDLSFNKNDHQFDNKEDRRVIFDIYCKAIRGEYFIIEMQKAPQDYFMNRAIFYTSTSITKQGVKGKKWQYDLKTVFFIGILDFEYDQDLTYWKKRKLLRSFELRDEQAVSLSDKLHYKLLQLPFFKKKPHQLRTRFDKWCYFLRNLESLNHIPNIFKEPIFMKALTSAEIENMEPLEYVAYLADMNAEMDYEMAMAENAAKAEKRGMERGMERGIEKGIERLLKNMILSIEQIADTYEVPIDYVLRIKNRIV